MTSKLRSGFYYGGIGFGDKSPNPVLYLFSAAF